jgi:hypothetical protein
MKNLHKHKRKVKAWFEVSPFNVVKQTAESRPGQRRLMHEMTLKHRKWPLTTGVAVRLMVSNSRCVIFFGKIVKHDRDYGSRCLVEFKSAIDLGDANGSRCAHVISFARLRRL